MDKGMFGLPEDIKHPSYCKYKAFSDIINSTKKQDFSLNLETQELKLGNLEFEIVPVCTSNDKAIVFFGEDHPTEYSYPDLSLALKELEYETCYETVMRNVDEVGTSQLNINKYTKHWTYIKAYTLTAIICNYLNAKTFASYECENGTMVWYLIKRHKNKNSLKILKECNKKISKMLKKPEESEHWYQTMGFI